MLAVELMGPERFCVYVDHPAGVDHALCGRVTDQLRDYLDRYTIDVSSPGIERPLRKPAHFGDVIGRKVAIRTAADIGGRKRFRGELVEAGAASRHRPGGRRELRDPVRRHRPWQPDRRG